MKITYTKFSHNGRPMVRVTGIQCLRNGVGYRDLPQDYMESYPHMYVIDEDGELCLYLIPEDRNTIHIGKNSVYGANRWREITRWIRQSSRKLRFYRVVARIRSNRWCGGENSTVDGCDCFPWVAEEED